MSKPKGRQPEKTDEEIVAKDKNRPCYVVWSFKHDAWWAPKRRGYTTQLAFAGRYTAQEAGAIATNSILGHEVAIHEGTARLNGEPTVKGLWQ